MKNKKIYVFLLLLLMNLSAGYAQHTVFKGIILDAATNLPLQDVEIYEDGVRKTVSRETGEFGILFKADTKLVLKKSGYGWRVLEVKNDDLQQVKEVKLRLSDPNFARFFINGIEVEYELYFDGQLVPKEQMVDAFNVSAETSGVITRIPNTGGNGILPSIRISTR